MERTDRPSGFFLQKILEAFKTVLKMVLAITLCLGWIPLNAYRLTRIGDDWARVAESLVARRAPEGEVRAVLSRFRGGDVFRVQKGNWRSPGSSAVVATDPSEFTFLFATGHVEAIVFLDSAGRAMAYRIGEGGSAV